VGIFLSTKHQEAKKSTGVVDIAYEEYKRDLPNYKTARDLMTPHVITATPEMPLEDAAKLMGEKHIGSLIVMKYQTPVGIITERDLFSKVFALGLFLRDEKVEDIMSCPLAGVSVDASVKQVAQALVSKKSRLGVFDAGTLVGIITAADIIKCLPDCPETEAKVEDFMAKPVIYADEETNVENIASTMGRERIGSVIITQKGEPCGIFTERDLLTSFLACGRALFTDVGPECSKPLVTIPAGTSIHRTATTMAVKHIRRLPVTKNGKIVGIITARDLVEAYAK
jgi:CBS domain-containing protein